MWEIYAYQNAASLLGIFNAAAAIHASGDYRAAVATVVFCGFLAALIAYALAPEKLQGWRWLATVVLVFSLLILPKATVGVVDRVGTEGMQVVDNVPLGMAALGSITSTVGHTLTTLFETAFQAIPGPGGLPGELTYQRAGLMFGNRLIKEASSVAFSDPSMRTDLVNFILNCTMFDLLDGTISPSGFSESTDVWPLMANTNPARFTTITAGGSQVMLSTCPMAYAGMIERMGGHLVLLERQFGIRMNPTLPPDAAASIIASQLEQAYLKNRIADAASSSSAILRQNAVLNALTDAGKLAVQRSNDPAAMVLAMGRAQATASQNVAWLTYGKLAEQALPVMRNVLEALAYALFPLVVLLLMTTSGQEAVNVFRGYLTLLIWIQLWPPLYAILNYVSTVYGSYELAAAATQGTGVNGTSLRTSSVIYGRAVAGEAVVGLLTLSIPPLAWALCRRMEGIGTAMLGGLSGLQSSASSAASAAVTGNVSNGNVSMDQVQLAPNRTSAYMSSVQHDVTGDTFSANAISGQTAVSLLRNQGFASRVVSARISEQEVRDASRQADAARAESVAASNERSSVLAEALSRGVSTSRSERNSAGSSSSSFEQSAETLNRLDQISRSVSETTGVSQSQVAKIALGATGRLGLNTPIGGLQASVSADKSYLAGLSKSEQKALSSMSSEQLAAFKQFGDRVSRDEAFVRAISRDDKEARELSTKLSNASSRSQRAEASLSERLAVSERLSSAYERGESIAIDLAQDPRNAEMLQHYARHYGGDSASARILLDAELARRSPRPFRLASVEEPMRRELDELGAIHRSHVASMPASPGRDSLTANGLDGVHERGSMLERERGDPRGRSTSADVRTAGQAIRSKVSSDITSFDESHKAARGDAGTLHADQSLLKRAASQAAADGTTTARDAAAVATKLLER